MFEFPVVLFAGVRLFARRCPNALVVSITLWGNNSPSTQQGNKSSSRSHLISNVFQMSFKQRSGCQRT